uniref:KIF-binding protein n=1 Tax=Parasteatoda tepidariorum TaxID=114398 RepID=A0A2L2Y9L6_PARTP
MFVSEFSVWVTSAHDRYLIIKELLKNSKNDPPAEPYRSKYSAREMLNQLASEIEKKWVSYGNIQVKLLYALFNFEIGVISIETDEIAAGCDALNVSWEYIKDFAEAPEGCHLALKILNQLGIIWSERGDVGKALEYLTKAETIYNSYKSTRDVSPYNSEDMFVLENATERNWSTFEKTFTHTLYYMAQVYEAVDDNDKSASCCRETLKRQRESGDYDVNDWALNCATLSQYYTKNEMYVVARHLLCCATDAMAKKEKELNEKKMDEEKDVWNEVRQTKAAISCFWVKYCIGLLLDSRNGINLAKNMMEKLFPDKFQLTDEKEISDQEAEIPINVTTFTEAKNVFLFAVNHISVAKLHYTLNQYANYHVQIVQDHNTLFKCLAHFEKDLGRLCKMFKRRIDLLEDVLRKLNPQYYLSVCRQLQFELGEIYFEMMDFKCRMAKNPNAHAVNKINSLILQGITHFNGFLKSFQDKDGKDPDVFSDDNARPVLMAQLYIGRLHSKLIETDINRKLHNLSKSKDCYKYIVDYVERNPEHERFIETELPIAKEMLELVPESMAQIEASIPQSF